MRACILMYAWMRTHHADEARCAVRQNHRPRKHVRALFHPNMSVSAGQHGGQHSDYFAQQVGVRARRLPQHHPHPGALRRHRLGTEDVPNVRRVQSEVGAPRRNAADRLHFLRIRRLHQLEPPEQHNRHLPGGQNHDHPCHCLNTDVFLRQDLLLAGETYFGNIY